MYKRIRDKYIDILAGKCFVDSSECDMWIADLVTRRKGGKGENDNDKRDLMENENMIRREMIRRKMEL